MNQATRNLLVIAILSLLVLIYSIYKRDQVLIDGSRIEADKLSFSSLPHFEAENLYTGKTVDSAKLEAGEELIIHFFASWCAPCLVELPLLISFANRYPNKRLVLMAEKDNKKALRKLFKEGLPSNILVLLDKDASIMAFFGSSRIPETFFFSSDKKIQYKIAGTYNWKE